MVKILLQGHFFNIRGIELSIGVLREANYTKLERILWVSDQIFDYKKQLVACKLILKTTYKKPEVASFHG